MTQLVDAGIRVVGFGNKRIPKIHPDDELGALDFRGSVKHDELVALYSGAQFTAFPFTNEPLGSVPIESMACGTPVLTYDKEGPAETVLDRETGWLVKDQVEFVRMARQLWGGFDREGFRERAVRRAAQFDPRAQARQIGNLLLGERAR